jgi:hypothetical protein
VDAGQGCCWEGKGGYRGVAQEARLATEQSSTSAGRVVDKLVHSWYSIEVMARHCCPMSIFVLLTTAVLADLVLILRPRPLLESGL